VTSVRVLVTGGLGFIGARLLETLIAHGVDAVGVDAAFFNGVPLTESQRATVDARRGALGDRLIELDVRSPDLGALLARVRPTHVVHLAGLSRADLALGADGRAFEANVATTQALLDALSAYGGVGRLVLASSSMVYGDFEDASCSELHPCRPREPYGASKLACEVLAQAFGRHRGCAVWIVRPSAVYGPGDFNGRVTERFARSALRGEPMVLFDEGREALDFTYVDDLVAGLELALTSPVPGSQVLNLTAGDGRTLLDLARIVQGYVPGARMQLSAQGSDRPRRGTLDIGRARALLGYAPEVALEEGMRRLLAAMGGEVPPVPLVRVSPPPPVSLSRPSIEEGEVAAVCRVLRSGWLAYGPETAAFEAEFSATLGAGPALAVNSGVSALILALRAGGVRGEVIVPAFTFAATANAVVLAGAEPVFADIEEARLGLDPEQVERAITPRTEAIVAVHLAGLPCCIDELARIAARRGLLLVEDAAQAAGARVGARYAGTVGHVGCFSFFPTKNITTGEGGMLVSGDAALVRRARTLSAHGVERGPTGEAPWHRPLAAVGYNFRLSGPQAALGRAQLRRLEEMNARRIALAERLTAALRGMPLILPSVPPGTHAVFQMYLVRLPDAGRRDALVYALRERGIEASVHYDTAVPDEAPYASQRAAPFPVARRVAGDVLSLPLHPGLSEAEIDRVAHHLRELLGGPEK
jgi:dTDP-4-amino-4,6-dideoxygalactose transaminase/nucleoside-diphosphate-sugar epimerase